jgi:hypothetical protein
MRVSSIEPAPGRDSRADFRQHASSDDVSRETIARRLATHASTIED